MCETEIVSCRVLNNKSYYHRFTAIKFAKPSWRALQSMIPFIANPTIFVEKYRTARIYSLWRFLPPRNTPDSFCRRFTRQNHRCAAWAVFFFSGNLSGQAPPSCCARPFRCLKTTGAFIATLRLQTQTVPWKFHKPTERDTDFPSTPLHKQGQELRSEQTVSPIHEQRNSLLIFAS